MPYESWAALVAEELGPQPYNITGIAARCPFGYPAVVETVSIPQGEEPSPPLLYLTCPALAAVLSRVENAGTTDRLQAACRTDQALRRLLDGVIHSYRQRGAVSCGRDATATVCTPRLGAGMGGPQDSATAACLHAYAATLLAVLSGWVASPGKQKRASIEEAKAAWARFLPPLEACWCRDARCSKWDTGQRRAVVDVGAISVRLLVADVINDRAWTVLRRAEITGLGEDLQAEGALSEAGRRRTAQAVVRFIEEARRCGADSLLLAGTHVTREASDGRQFLYDLGLENAVPAVVLSDAREAELTYAGVCAGVRDDPVVLYVGGRASTLLGPSENGLVETAHLEVGANCATETWLTCDPPTIRQAACVYYEAARALHDLRPRFGAARGRRRLVGIAGTITTLACLDAGLEHYDPDVLHGRELSLERVQVLVACLSALPSQGRETLPGMQRGRAAVMVGGAVIVQAAMETLGYEVLTVSEHDLLDGLVLRGVRASGPIAGAVVGPPTRCDLSKTVYESNKSGGNQDYEGGLA